MGMHSIMLVDCPESRIRLYVADYNHELWKNCTTPISLAYHPHHCQLTLHVTNGILQNKIVRVVNEVTGNDCMEFDRWIYSSKINTDTMRFIKDGTDFLQDVSTTNILQGESQFMKASTIHTVFVPENTCASWLVYEGKEWDGYKPYAWSNQDLGIVNAGGLYGNATEYDINHLLRISNLI